MRWYCPGRCGRNIPYTLAHKNCLILVYRCLWLSATTFTDDARHEIIDGPLKLILKLGSGAFCLLGLQCMRLRLWFQLYLTCRTPRLHNIQNLQLLTLRWHSFPGCGRARDSIVLFIKATNTFQTDWKVPISIFLDQQYHIWTWTSMWNLKCGTSDCNSQVWSNLPKPAGSWVPVWVWPSTSQQFWSLHMFSTETPCSWAPNLHRWRVTWVGY